MLRRLREKMVRRREQVTTEESVMRDLEGYGRVQFSSRRETRISTSYGRYPGGEPYDVIVISRGEFKGRAYALSEKESGGINVSRVE